VLSLAVEQGGQHAQHGFGQIFEAGVGVTQDYAEPFVQPPPPTHLFPNKRHIHRPKKEKTEQVY